MSPPSRILHTTASLHVGGSGRLLLRNLSYGCDGDFEHHVAFLMPRYELVPEFRALGIEPLCLGHRHRWHAPRTLWRLVRLIREKHIDLLHANLPLDHAFSSLAGRLTGRPVIATLHNASSPNQLRQIGEDRLLARIRWRLATVGIDRYLAVSETARKAHILHGLPEERISVQASGIPLEILDGPPDPNGLAEIRRGLGLDTDSPILLNVGRLHPFKGQKFLIDVMVELSQREPRAQLLIAGEGSERQALERAIAETGLGDRIHLLGRRDDVPQLLALADLFLFPSVTEALPLALLEAMAAGRPIVASNIESIAAILEDEVTGRLVSSRAPHRWASIVLKLLDNPEHANRLGKAARTTAKERWNLRRTVVALEEEYRRLLGRGRKAP